MNKDDIRIKENECGRQLVILYQNKEYKFQMVKSYEDLKGISKEIEKVIGENANE